MVGERVQLRDVLLEQQLGNLLAEEPLGEQPEVKWMP
jgi:hypothetical protein